MFTGLVETVGLIRWIKKIDRGANLTLESDFLAKRVRTGDSISVNGCCLTVTQYNRERIEFELLEETLQRTNLRLLKPDSVVNLERALAAGDRLGGHFVQGHVDCTAEVLAAERVDRDLKLTVALPENFAGYLAFKGSIAVNGVSLTVAEVAKDRFILWIIPHTRKQTNLGHLEPGDLVNLEFDILAKYVERQLEVRADALQ